MTLEERFEALIKQNEFLSKKIQEDAQKNQETQAQNEYLRKQLGSVLKQKQRLNEDTIQSEPRMHEQVFSHGVGSSSEEELTRMTREEQRFKLVQTTSKWKFLNLKASLILRSSLIGYILLREFLSTRTSKKTRR